MRRVLAWLALVGIAALILAVAVPVVLMIIVFVGAVLAIVGLLGLSIWACNSLERRATQQPK